MLNEKALSYPLGEKVNKFVFLVDRKLGCPGIEEKIKGEVSRIPAYIEKGDLAPQPAMDICWKHND